MNSIYIEPQIKEDADNLSKIVYQQIKEHRYDDSDTSFKLDDKVYDQYKKAIKYLVSEGFIKEERAIGHKYPIKMRLTNPLYKSYICELTDDAAMLSKLTGIMNSMTEGEQIRAADAREKGINLPLPIIRAVFELYEYKQDGIMSKTIGESLYIKN